jgi:hypothetical protein
MGLANLLFTIGGIWHEMSSRGSFLVGCILLYLSRADFLRVIFFARACSAEASYFCFGKSNQNHFPWSAPAAPVPCAAQKNPCSPNSQLLLRLLSVS